MSELLDRIKLHRDAIATALQNNDFPSLLSSLENFGNYLASCPDDKAQHNLAEQNAMELFQLSPEVIGYFRVQPIASNNLSLLNLATVVGQLINGDCCHFNKLALVSDFAFSCSLATNTYLNLLPETVRRAYFLQDGQGYELQDVEAEEAAVRLQITALLTKRIWHQLIRELERYFYNPAQKVCDKVVMLAALLMHLSPDAVSMKNVVIAALTENEWYDTDFSDDQLILLDALALRLQQSDLGAFADAAKVVVAISDTILSKCARNLELDQAHNQLISDIAAMRNQGRKLFTDGKKSVANKFADLCNNLDREVSFFFSLDAKQQQQKLQGFKLRCRQTLHDADRSLGDNKAWRRVMVNTLLVIATGGVGGLVVMAHKIKTNRSGFFAQRNCWQKQVRQLNARINKVSVADIKPSNIMSVA